MFDTKQNLRALRRQRLDGWLIGQGLRLDEYPFWTDAQQIAELAEFARLDKIYEEEKAALAVRISTASADEIAAWKPENRI